MILFDAHREVFTMRRAISTLCATALSVAMGLTSVASSGAAFLMPEPIMKSSNIETVRDHRGNMNKKMRRHNNGHYQGRPGGWNGGKHSHSSRPGHWNGHNGYQHSRPGYRRHSDGWWYPLAAFAAGAAIIGASKQPTRAPVMSRNHVNWCANKYRTYRASDNTFQPNNGPRAQCYSPYR